MIRKPQGYDEMKVYDALEKLPTGGYVLKILGVKIESYNWGEVLVMRIDVNEGEQAGFYQKNYEMQQENKKWKGTFRINLPKNDGSEQDSWAIKRLKAAMTAIEKSNEGYVWNWDENSLKGKIVGGLFGNKEYEYNGQRGFFTDCRTLCSVDRIRSGNFTIPADKMLKDSANNGSVSGGFMTAEMPDSFEAIDEQVPF